MNIENNVKLLDQFNDWVKFKYQLYSGLLFSLELEDGEKVSHVFVNFVDYIKEKIDNAENPLNIVEEYFKSDRLILSQEQLFHRLFRYMQYVERQIAIFDAIEEASTVKMNEQETSLNHVLHFISQSNQVKELMQYLQVYRTRIVLTAHPTQFYPGHVLGIINDLSKAIKNDDLNEIKNLCIQISRTSFKNKKNITPVDEANRIIWYLKNVFYQILPQIYEKIKSFFDQSTSHLSKQVDFPQSFIDIGFWPGGDRDGNPYVTSKITKKVANQLKLAILECYIEDIGYIRRRLTFYNVYEKLAEIISKLKILHLNTTHQIEGNNTSNISSTYQNRDELLVDIFETREILINQYNNCFIQLIDKFIYKVNHFGFFFASMDMRQDSSIHKKTISEVIDICQIKGIEEYGKYIDVPKEKETAVILRLLNQLDKTDIKIYDLIQSAIEKNTLSEITKETILSFRTAVEIQASNGVEGLHRYIISHSENSSDILEVLFLTRISVKNIKNEIPFDIIPLFETVEDMKHSSNTMAFLYQNDIYKKHLKNRQMIQTVMLGFSDGTKDGGYMTSNWSIYKSKEEMTQISNKEGVSIIFFDGRGGPPSRGGGNTSRFYQSQGDNISKREIQVTIQGQTISTNFANKEIGMYNVESLFISGFSNSFLGLQPQITSEDEKNLLEKISSKSQSHYLALRNHPLFIEYLTNVTPLQLFSLLNVASRPVSRKSSNKIEFDSLRAIPFVSSWSQMRQNIPGYYGLGYAFSELIREGFLDDLKKLYKNSLFFKTLIDNSMQSLAKTIFSLTSYISKDKKYGKFWLMLKEEQEKAQEMILLVSETKEIMEKEAVVKASINLRKEIVLPLLVIQQYAFQKMKDNNVSKEDQTIYQKLAIKGIAPNINASRNSA